MFSVFWLQYLGLVVLNLKVLSKPVSPGAGFPVDLQQGRRISFLPGFQAPRCGRFGVTVMVWTWRVVAVSQEPSCRISANYFASSDPHHDISKQLVDTTFV